MSKWTREVIKIKTLDVIQKILEFLDESMDAERVDITPIKPETLGITDAKWSRVISMLLEEGLIDGFADVTTMGCEYTQYKSIEPRITLRGITYLAENSNASKLYRAAKEIKDWIPGL